MDHLTHNLKSKTLKLLLTSVLISLMSCEIRRTPCVYQIPDGYVGWVLIEYGQSNYPAIPIIDEKKVFQIGTNGVLITSSHFEEGWATDNYFYSGNKHQRLAMTESGRGGRIWGASTGYSQVQGQKGIEYQKFFVGDENQYMRSGDRPRP